MAGHRPGSALGRPAREGHPARLRQVRPAGRRHDGQRHHLPRPLLGARSGQGARLLARAGGPALEAARELELRRDQGADRRARQGSRRRGPRSGGRPHAAFPASLPADPEPAAPPRAALGRDGRRGGAARRGRAARARGDAGARRRAVGQGRLRRPRDRQGGPARPRHARGARGGDPDDPRAREDGGGPGAPAAGRSRRLPDVERRRHGRLLPGREPGADGVAAAQRPGEVLRPRRAGRDHPPGPDRGRHGAPVLRAPAGEGAGRVRAPVPRADPRAHARRPALPGAAAAHRHGRGGFHGRGGGGAAPRHGVQALDGADGRDRGAAARGDGGAGHRRRGAGPDREVHHVLRPLRLSRVARGELRADRLRELLPEGAPPGGVPRVAPELLADGLLPSGDPRQGRAAARRRGPADRRDALGMEVPVGRARRAPRAAVRAGAARGDGPAHRGGAGARAVCGRGGAGAAVRAAPRRAFAAGRGRRARGLRARPPRGALAGREGGAPGRAAPGTSCPRTIPRRCPR